MMCRTRGSKDMILIFEASMVLESVVWVEKCDERKVAANAPKSVKTSNWSRLHVPASFNTSFGASACVDTAGFLSSSIMFARLDLDWN